MCQFRQNSADTIMANLIIFEEMGHYQYYDYLTVIHRKIQEILSMVNIMLGFGPPQMNEGRPTDFCFEYLTSQHLVWVLAQVEHKN